ncbi:hypothetical protein KIL84_015153 [Mauremys mutica]|uniref:Uncharacterized protein n=1 Tax=Mauremys mutica TaxID=74926 RepID=A0A9D3WQ96_9SAUR|nr:hypothetical protein KIL84_015153 [Mauremys mutica]
MRKRQSQLTPTEDTGCSRRCLSLEWRKRFFYLRVPAEGLHCLPVTVSVGEMLRSRTDRKSSLTHLRNTASNNVPFGLTFSLEGGKARERLAPSSASPSPSPKERDFYLFQKCIRTGKTLSKAM